MLIRHTACFPLSPMLDHPVSVVLATFVAALVPIVGLAPRAPPTRLVLAVRLAAVALTADDERRPAPPTLDLSTVCAHRLPRATQKTWSVETSRAISDRAPLV